MPLNASTTYNVAPITGFGGYDLQIVPNPMGVSLLNVTIRVYIRDERQNPSGSTDTFLNTWRGHIQNDWNDKFEYESNAGDRIRVRFTLLRAVTVAGAHFPVQLIDGYAQSSGLKFPSPNNDPFNNRIWLTLADRDNQPYYLANAQGLMSGVVGVQRMAALDTERNRVVQSAPGGQDAFDVQMHRAGNTWTVHPNAVAGLNAFCTALSQTPSWLPPPPLIIHTQSGLRDKANTLAAAVMNHLRQRGVTAKIATEAQKTKKRWKWPGTASGTTATARIEVEGVNQMVKQWRSDYVVTSHEFGHLIGLPDEYLDYSTFSNQTIRNSQPLWDALCGLANVPTRNWHSQFNESMMSIGKRLYKAHGATILSSLDAMAGWFPNNIPNGSWQIRTP